MWNAWLAAKIARVNIRAGTNTNIKCRGFVGFSGTLAIISSVLLTSQVKELAPIPVKCLPCVTKEVSGRARTGTQGWRLLTQSSNH